MQGVRVVMRGSQHQAGAAEPLGELAAAVDADVPAGHLVVLA